MKFGTYMFEAKKVPGFDFDLFRVKPEVGRRMPPKADMYSNIAIFGDNVTARIHPDWISQSDAFTQIGSANPTWDPHGEPTTTTTYAGKSSAQHNQSTEQNNSTTWKTSPAKAKASG